MERQGYTVDGRGRAGVVAWVRLARVYQRTERLLTEQVRRHGLSLAQFDVLATVGADEGCTQQRLADKLLVTKGNVAQLLDRMERLGLVERRPSGTGRANRLHLTEAGWARRAEVLGEHERLAAGIFDGLDGEELTALRRALRTVDHDLQGRRGTSSRSTTGED